MLDAAPLSISKAEAVPIHPPAEELATSTRVERASASTAAPPPLPARPEGASAEASGTSDITSQAALGLGVAGPSTMPSRPLSEISENEDRRRSANRLSHHSRSGKDDEKRSSRATSRPGSRTASRPTSLVLDDATANKRLSGHIQTLTLNLNDYAAAVKRPPSAISNKSRDSLVPANSGPSTPGGRSVSAGASLGGPPKPERPVLALRTTSISSIKEVKKEEDDGVALSSPKSPSDTKEGHPLLMAKRASLRPSPLGATYADVVKPTSPTTSSPAFNAIATQPFDSVTSLASTTISSELHPSTSLPTARPVIKTKSSWLRRASGTAGLRSKSKSPVTAEANLPASTSLPPALPPRKGGLVGSDSETSLESTGSKSKPALPPRKNSYASVAAGSSRSGLAEGVGRPAYSPPISTIPSRDNISNIRSRITAWTAAASQSSASGSMPRSESTATLASIAGSTTRSSARGMIGSAGSAVQKGWAGLRARGVGGSISSMSALSSQGQNQMYSQDKAKRDRSVSAQATMSATPDGPILESTSVKRPSGHRTCLVYGKDITAVGKEWGVVDEEGLEEREQQRRAVLPAVVVRCVDYLSIWGPKEEGMFRISGRSSHVARLRREFDAGADLDMTDCHPGDLDPHAVSGTLKSYLRELPQPLLTKSLQPRFEAAMRKETTEDGEVEDIKDLLASLPPAHWFLLADIVTLLSLIASHQTTNRMTIRALMLSLGPSLNIPGNVFSELIDRREELFAAPPPPTAAGQMASLIDFGETSIPPVEIPNTSPSTSGAGRPLTPLSDASAPLERDKPRKSPLLASKPSMTRLFGMSASSARRGSADTTATTISSVGLAPPRVDLDMDSPRLPSFESDNRPSFELPSSVLSEKPLPPLEPIISASPSNSSALGEMHYRSGTVEERQRTFSNASSSTPIADMFAGQSKFPPLRSQKSSNNVNIGMSASTSSPVIGLTGVDFDARTGTAPGNKSKSAPANPATVIRRGQAGFFGSGDRSERHTRCHSLASTGYKGKATPAAVGGNGSMGPPPLPPRTLGDARRLSLSGAADEAEKVEMMV